MSLHNKIVAEEYQHIYFLLGNHSAYLLVSSQRTGEKPCNLLFKWAYQLPFLLDNEFGDESSCSACCPDIVFCKHFPIELHPVDKFFLSSVVSDKCNIDFFHSLIVFMLRNPFCASKIVFQNNLYDFLHTDQFPAAELHNDFVESGALTENFDARC